jgi:hypothetical protein
VFKNGILKSGVLKKPNALYPRDILVVKLNKENQLTDSQPCDMCMHIMYKNNIRRVYYSTRTTIQFRMIAHINLNDYFRNKHHLTVRHISRGINTMFDIVGYSKRIRSLRLPLSKQQKTFIFDRYITDKMLYKE